MKYKLKIKRNKLNRKELELNLRNQYKGVKLTYV